MKLQNVRPGLSSKRRKIAKSATLALVASAVFLAASAGNPATVAAQGITAGGNVAMFTIDGDPVYAITGLFQTDFLGATVIGGWGTDGQTVQYVVIVPTADPAVFVYIVAPQPAGSQAGTAGTFTVMPDGSIQWANNQLLGGPAFPF